MKLTTKQEADLIQVYETWWNSYLNGDVNTYDSFLADNFHFVGSTNGEEYLSKKDTTAFFNATADQLAGKAELRNLKRVIEELDGGLILITDLADAYVISEPEWVFYSRFRFTSLMKETSIGWRFIYQHFSAPDTKAQEGETLGTEQITKENQELRDAIKRRTVELEHKTRELEIEAALERVRSRSMAMHKSEELADLSLELVKQVQALGVSTWFCAFNINDEDGNGSMEWGSNGIGTFPKYRTPREGVFLRYYKAGKKGETLLINEIGENECPAHYEYLCSLPGVGDQLLQMKEAGIPFPTSQIDHVAFFKYGYLLFITYDPVPEAHDIFIRFAKVFEQTYTRFLDLQKAEAQAREAQIEAALERVRSSAMAMHTSESFLEVIHALREQMAGLGEKELESILIHIYNEKREEFEAWYSYRHTSDPTGKIIHGNVLLNWTKTERACKDKEKYYSTETDYTIVADYKMLKEWYEYLEIVVPEVVEYDEIGKILIPDVLYYNYSKFSGGAMLLITNNEASDDSKHLLKRSAEVFNLAYTRFLDLQKAEAQARESQIELGLERVRARAMAMQHSNELSDLVDTVFKELTKLDFAISMCIINIIDESNLSNMVWAANPDTGKPPDSYYMKFEDYPFHHAMMKGYKERSKKFIYVIEGEEKKIYDEYLFNETEFSKMPLEAQAASKALKKYVASFTFSNFGGLQTVAGEDLSDENLDILARFGKVFDLTYTRFNDLKQAEAQAKEAKIEAALERVRSHSLSMQKSEELKNVIQVVYDQFIHLNIQIEHTGFIMDYKERDDMFIWLADKHAVPFQVTIPYFDCAHWNSFIEAKAKKQNIFTNNLSFEEKNKFYQDLFNVIPGVPKDALDYYSSCPGLAISTVLLDNVGLYIENFSGIPFTDDENSTLMRFGKVFQQTYTRFRDLQKAEAQAREAQIELSLERIRSQVMAMRESADLLDIVVAMRSEFVVLGHEAHYFWHMRWMPDKYEKAMTSGDGTRIGMVMKLPRHIHGDIQLVADWEKSDEPTLIFMMDVETAINYVEKMVRLGDFEQVDPNAPTIDDIRHIGGLTFIMARTTHGEIGYSLPGMVPEPSVEGIATLARFAGVFDLAYKRFEDLKIREEKNRETLIELAMERVRTKTMAMQHSDELPEAANVLFLEVQNLGIPAWSCGYNILSADKKSSLCIMSSEGEVQAPFKLPLTEHESFLPWYEALVNDKDFFVNGQGGEELADHYRYMSTLPELKPVFKQFEEAGISLPTFQINHLAKFKQGFLLFITYQPVPEAHDIFKRFAILFEQTYTRFLDLQKAEAQAREAEIELALERVRARTMAMQSSDELREAVLVINEQLQHLGFYSRATNIIIIDKDSGDTEYWVSGFTKDIYPVSYPVPKLDHPYYDALLKPWRNGDQYIVYKYEGDGKRSFDKIFFTETGFKNVPEEAKDAMTSLPSVTLSTAFFTNGALQVIGPKPIAEEKVIILKRFAKVFEQTYTRFLDLQKAEAQTKEAQIEAALERVRARTMAMQKSEDMNQTASEMFKQIQALGMQPWACGFNIFDKNEKAVTQYMSLADGGISPPFRTPLIEDPFFINIYEARQRGEELLVWESKGESLAETYRYMFSLPGSMEIFGDLENSGFEMPKFQITHCAYFSQGYLVFITYEAASESHDIFKRFAKVFEQTYTRFLDLQKAEAQTREAQINLAVERVRARALAMFKSEEILQVVHKLKEEIMGLDIPNVIAATIHLKENDGRCRIWDISSIELNDEALHHPMDIRFKLEDTDPNFFIRRIWGNSANYFVEIQDENDLKRTIQWLRDNDRNQQADETEQFIENTKLKKLYHPTIQINKGRMCIDLLEAPEPEIASILEKMGAAFDLAYKRFEDLKNSESQLRESQIEAALEKVRSRTLAMQQSNELAETSAVLFKQLINLGIEPNRLYITVMKDDSSEAEFWITDENGSKVSAAYRDNLNLNPTFKKMLDGWKAKEKSLVIDIQGAELQEYFNHLDSLHVSFKNGLKQKRRIQYLAYFNQGFIGMASPDEQPESTMHLLERFAAVFNLTYTRFNDLKIAEAHAIQAEEDLVKLQTEKKRAEEALNELQSAQKQLIQSEKMASLGELTAGIAHEIQNPLNFVNNFSELSKELLDEMQSAIESGDDAEVKDIMQDIIQNLEKINLHGKRADAIVKGMLQHSRSNNGQKEPTNINALADEYLRLAYHGLRAKDKSFNATLKTDFDESIGNINIIPQDIGRVILNLITNAFYVVTEKKKENIAGYEPTVFIKTKKVGDKVLISVGDNGNGIPQHILDKIFQPFFTTKPTGQGTGLGLSLSYDIVKAHGGEINIQTKENTGTEFIIQLPANNN